jgi:integrase
VPENLYDRKGIWYARFAAGGKLRRVCLRTSDLRQAKTRLKALKTQYENASFGIEEARQWGDAVVSYTRGVLDAGSVKPATAKRYEVSLRQIDPYFKTLPISAIDNSQIARFIAARQAEGAKNATIRRDLTTISRVVAYSNASGNGGENAALAYDRKLIKERRAPIKEPTDEEIELAAGMAPPEWAVLLRFLRATGMRLGEALRARESDLDGNALTIRETKSGKVRTIIVPQDAIPQVRPGRRLMEALPEETEPVSCKWPHFRRQMPDMPRFRLHDLRHAYAIDQIRSGRDIYDLSHHLGHSSVKVTEIYLGYAASSRAKSRQQVTPEVTQAGRDVTQKPLTDSPEMLGKWRRG